MIVKFLTIILQEIVALGQQGGILAGMLSSTVLTLLVVPVFYIVLDDGVEWFKARVRRLLGRAPVHSEVQPG